MLVNRNIKYTRNLLQKYQSENSGRVLNQSEHLFKALSCGCNIVVFSILQLRWSLQNIVHKMKASIFLIAFLLVAGVVTQSPDNDTVDTNVGKVRGLKVKAVNGKSLWSFRGIRYAMPPVGKLRFAKPVPYPKEKDTIDARKQKPLCIQKLSTNETTSEDCLYLNIFLKDISNQFDSKKKVLVSLYDEREFSYDPGSIVTDHDIIVVIVQYRIGPFGYLALKTGGTLGNYGLWDQVLALKWVKKNIGAFGGDPDDVTVAWNEKTQCLALSPMSKGLFTKVFATGGMTWYPSGADEQSDKEIIDFAKSLQCWKDKNATVLFLDDKFDIIQCLRSLPTLDPSKTELFNIDYVKSWSAFGPLIDGDFIPKLIPSLLKDDHHLENIGFYDRKYFISINNNLNYFWANQFLSLKEVAYKNLRERNDAEKVKIWNDYSLKWAKVIIRSRLNIESVSDDLASRLMYWYQTNSHLDPIIELQTDCRHTIRAYDMLDTTARGRHTNVWFLHFNHYPDYLKDDVHGMIYNLDLLYLFDIDMDVVRQSYEPYVIGEFEEEDYGLKKSFSALVAAFVLNGNPETPLLTQIATGWPTYDLVGRYYLDFKSRPTVKRNWKKQIRELWEKDLPNWAYKQMENHQFEL